MMFTAFIIGVIFIGLFVYAVIGNLAYHLYYDGCNSLFDDDDAAKVAAAFWIVTLPIGGGIILGNWIIENEFGMVCLVALKEWVDARRKRSRD